MWYGEINIKSPYGVFDAVNRSVQNKNPASDKDTILEEASTSHRP